MLKYRIMVLSLFIISICAFGFVKAIEAPLMGKVIYLDPGHGGVDPGAIYKEIYESNLNLEISKKLQLELEKLGAIVYLTREGDYDLAVPNTINRKRSDLSRRGNLINKSNCDAYLSIHLNAETSSTWRGGQVFYDDVNEKNELLATILQQYFKENLYSKRKIKKIDEMYLSRRVKVPGVLLEVGFITNPNDRYLLRQSSYQTKLAKVISKALITYFSQI
ncbi:MAG: N-acetylmuramoyl-L-alanine amidase [Bacilli bacterium]|nr:N-acetylmuramoyl-L-alanine amidase [Bacilli bacterium]MDD4809048.1 N-acetylmuramoyl-L-alanine amidase [Bacilli bacterium]